MPFSPQNNGSPDSMEIIPAPPLVLDHGSGSEASDQLQDEGSVSPLQIDDDWQQESPPEDSPPQVYQPAMDPPTFVANPPNSPPSRGRPVTLNRNFLSGESSRSYSAPAHVYSPFFTVFEPARVPKSSYSEDYGPLVDLLLTEGHMPDRQWQIATKEAFAEVSIIYEDLGCIYSDSDSDTDYERPGQLIVKIIHKGVHATGYPCKDEDGQLLLVGNMSPSSFLEVSWEQLNNYTRKGGQVRPLKMEENNMIIEINGFAIEIEYKQVRIETLKRV